MKSKLSRRAIIAGSLVSIAAPEAVKANAAPQDWPDSLARTFEALQVLSKNPQGLKIMEILTNSFTPNYRKGDLIFVQTAKAKATDHVYLKRKSAESIFGELVHEDEKAIYVRGFKSGDSLQSVPLNTISEWGRIVASYRV